MTKTSAAAFDTDVLWTRVKPALADALELSGAARAEFLHRLRAADPALADEVDQLLEMSAQTGHLLDDTPSGLIQEMMRARDGLAFEGAILGAYRVVRLIGSGGMGDVYLGERADGAFEKQVAIKLLRDALATDTDISRFERERQILAGFDHVNLAKIIDGGVTDAGMPYFVMEYVDGVALDDYCERTRAGVAERVSLLRSVCQVVHYVNQRGVVHRDLKARNILVTAAGVVKLLDFGIATRPDDARGPADRTKTALRSMTLLYSSPEQVRGDPVGPGSDVYALGVVTFRLLTGAFPYALSPDDASSFELARAICDQEPRRMSDAVAGDDRSRALRRELRGDLDEIVAKALRKEPTARYLCAEDMGDDLFRHQCLLPVQARRGAWSYRLGRWLLKHRGFAGAAIVANVALLAALTVSLEQSREARVQRERAERNFASVRALANVFLFDFDDAVSRLPGAMAARRLVVEKAQVYLGALAADAASDPALALELAVSYRKIGEIQGRRDVPNLGDLVGATASFDRSIALLRPLASAESSGAVSTHARLELAHALSRQATIRHDQGQYAQAEALQREVQDNLAKVLQVEPDNLDAQTARASAYGWQGWLRLQQGDVAGSDRNSAIGEKLLLQILAEHPGNTTATNFLATTFARRSIWFLEGDTTPEGARRALAPLHRWLELETALRTQEPNNPSYTGAMAETYNYLGRALQRLGRPYEAIEAMKTCLALLGQEIQLDPGDQMARDVLMIAHISLASMYLQQDDPVSARTHAQQAVADYDLMPDAAHKSVVRLDAAAAHEDAGRAWASLSTRASGHPAQAAEAHRQSCRELAKSLSLILAASDTGESRTAELSAPKVQHELAGCAKGDR